MLLEAETAVREALRRDYAEATSSRTAFADNLMILAKVLHRQGKNDDALLKGKQALSIYKKCLGWKSELVRQTKAEIAQFANRPTETAPKLGEAA
jgi:hypothetical protein